MSSTITTKLLATLVTVFSLVLASSTAYQYWQQKELMNSVLSEQLHDKASTVSYTHLTLPTSTHGDV